MQGIGPDSGISGEKLFEIFKSFGNYSLNYVYKGIFDPMLTDRILSLAENNMNITGESSKTQKRVYFVMVESLQNITRHQDVNQTSQNHAFFVVQNKAGEYDLSSGNIIEKSKVDDLKEKLDKINSLNPEELKDYYKNVLENTGMSDKGGAGLGLIEMARRSGNKLSYDFQPLDNDYSYFYFKSKITPAPTEIGGQKMMADVKNLHRFTQSNNIHMIYQGMFTHDNLKSLLSMTEESMNKSGDLAFKRKAVNIMIELLQNICNHASKPNPQDEGIPGMLMVSSDEKGCYFASGNYIEKANEAELRTKIERINNSSEKELDELYSQIIVREVVPGQRGAGLGFIDMRMKSGGKIEHHTMPFNDQLSFISINIFIPF
jgi:coenzyme F420-reducing hydrogenase delta subunit